MRPHQPAHGSKALQKGYSIILKRENANGKEGVNLLGISETAEAVGFRTQSVKLDFETLTNDATLPAIFTGSKTILLFYTKPKEYVSKFKTF